MSNFPSAASSRLWYVLELFCIAASVLFQQPQELRSDPGAAWQEEGMWDPRGVSCNTEPNKAWGVPSVPGSFLTGVSPQFIFTVIFLERQITEGNKY